jgi:2-oxoglutarate ferredoxin oxidoreductase subunit alpha
MEHRVGGLEKADLTGHISYDPANHQRMSELRAAKVKRIADHLPPTDVYGEAKGDLLVVSWGGTFGAVRMGVERVRARGKQIGHVHLRWLSPLPKDLGEILDRFDRVVVPELNMGQLVKVLRAEYLVDARSIAKIEGQPYKTSEIEGALMAQLESN